MGKPTGFMDYERLLPPDRPVSERIHDWNEFHTRLNEEEQRIQGARCMNCGIPFCHSGMLLGDAASGCPLNNLIPEWNDLIYRGLWRQAVKRLLKTNNFPEFTGRVCPAPCEGSCTIGINAPQVTIKMNECAIIDKAWDEGWIKPEPPKLRTGKRVAVIGSGPSGLACADQLNKSGHAVTVFEREDRPGGLLMYGIPNMKLDRAVVLRRIALMREEGVIFRTGADVGRDINPAELLKRFDAVVLCCGATKPRDLRIEGRELKGIHFAMEFLRSNTKSLLDSSLTDGRYISAKDRDVIIIGGGDTGTDCVGTSIRHGCKSVRQLEIMPLPPEARAPQNPWPEWPFVLKTDYGQQEAVSLQGCDPRIYQATAKRFEGDENGNVKAVHTVSVEWKKNENGHMTPVEIVGSERVLAGTACAVGNGLSRPRGLSADAFVGTRPALQHQGGIRKPPDKCRGHFCSRRYAQRAKSGGMGNQRGVPPPVSVTDI